MQPNSSASVAERGQRPEVAVHAEDAVGDEQLLLSGGQVLDDLARGVDVFVRKDLDGGSAQPAAVDDARVIQFIRDDDVVFCEDGRDGAGVGGEPALKHDDRFGLLEHGQPTFEFHVNRHRAGDRAHGAGAHTEFFGRLDHRGDELGMRRETEIVVRRQVDDLFAVEPARGLLFTFEHTQRPVEALLTKVVEFGCEKCEGILTHAEIIEVSATPWCYLSANKRSEPLATSSLAPAPRSQFEIPSPLPSKYADSCTTTCVAPDAISVCHAASRSPGS